MSDLTNVPPEIVVPGSISNLGPGFDVLSVAVQLYLRAQIVEVRPSEPDTVTWEFQAPVRLARTASNPPTVWRGTRSGRRRLDFACGSPAIFRKPPASAAAPRPPSPACGCMRR